VTLKNSLSLFSIFVSSKGVRIGTNVFFFFGFFFANITTKPLILALTIVQTILLNIDSAPSVYNGL
jgi:hypothetical protein